MYHSVFIEQYKLLYERITDLFELIDENKLVEAISLLRTKGVSLMNEFKIKISDADLELFKEYIEIMKSEGGDWTIETAIRTLATVTVQDRIEDYHKNMDEENCVCCNECEHIDSEGDCDKSASRFYGDCVDGTVRRCALFEKR